MKKGFSLIELIFAMVVIGICIAAIPKIVNASLESDEISYKQEYFYEVKEFYGLIRNLPFSKQNVSYDDYKQNSLLSQFVATCKEKVADFKPQYEVNELSLININPRYGRASSLKNSYAARVLETGAGPKGLNNTNFTNALGQSFSYVFADPTKGSKVDSSYKFKSLNTKGTASIDYKKVSGNDFYASVAPCDIELTFLYKLQIYDDKNEIFLSFDTFYNTFGRLDSIYSQYSMMTQDTTWQNTNEDKLKSYLSL